MAGKSCWIEHIYRFDYIKNKFLNVMKWLFLSFIFLSGCTSNINEKNSVETLANSFFEHYAIRSDWKGFQALYADDMVFEDVIYRLKFDKTEFLQFYNWPDTAFSKHPDFPATLVLEELALTDSSAIGRGVFNPFYYGGKLFSLDHKWRFNMSLQFNDEGKIIKHIDFIEYPPEFLQQAAATLTEK